MAILRDSSKIKARIFFEVMGWPAEALNAHLKKLLDLLKTKGWSIYREEYADPEKIGEKMYTSHVEFEVEIPDISTLFQFCLAYAPSVVEIIEPSEIYLTAAEIQDIIADMNSKIHEMDKSIKLLAAQVAQFKKQAKTEEKSEEKPEIKVTLGGDSEENK